MSVVSIGHNRLDFIARRIQSGYDRATKGGVEWVEGSLELAAALAEAREAMPADIAFSDWLKHSKLDFYGKNERTALLGFASDVALARVILTESKSRSYQNIWRDNKGRFPANRKPAQKSAKPRVRNPNRASIYRRMKLGDETVDKLKGTSLDSAAELDELVMLNRGAAEGEHTATVKQLVAAAVAGKDVSAIAESKKIAPTAGRKMPSLIAAWRKRMVFAWEHAEKQQQQNLIEYLMDHMKK